MNRPKHLYMEEDWPLGSLRYYEDLLNGAGKYKHTSVASWLRALHKEYNGNAAKTAAVIGVSYSCVTRWFRRLGLKVKTRGGREPLNHPRRSEVGSLYEELGSGPAVAKELGVCTRKVYDWLEEDRIPRRRQYERARND
jgi:hypothetical protein